MREVIITVIVVIEEKAKVIRLTGQNGRYLMLSNNGQQLTVNRAQILTHTRYRWTMTMSSHKESFIKTDMFDLLFCALVASCFCVSFVGQSVCL